MKINDNYKYLISVNQWALIEFFNLNKIGKERFKKLKSNHCILLFLLVDLCTKGNFLKKSVNGFVYTYISTSLILDNLPLFYLKDTNQDNQKEYERLNRTLQNLFNRLKELGLLKIYIEGNTKRYVYINSEFLRLCNKGDDKLTPFEFVCKYWLNDLEEIRGKYLYSFNRNKNKYFKVEEKFFFNEYSYQLEKTNYNISKWDILPRLESYITENIKDPYFVEHLNELNSL
ncbi:hypothetical protein IU405_07560 [Polaribacter sp. BAL334]|uniref:hypothetical protein n=1 Tax=Polaribacter sp. BAL334 TaxID=1708178 RepID=UPI0018D23DFC|nr:hypothetical protein [Polaribacter sp. BAL334]MBG7612103.1 hypothetical protein [Polaribacter sp. BAL334]